MSHQLPELPGLPNGENHALTVGNNHGLPPAIRTVYAEPAPAPEPDDIQALLQYLRILWRNKWTLALALVLGALVAVGASLYTVPMYRAGATLEIGDMREPISSPFLGGDSTLVTQSQLLASGSMRTRTATKLNSQVPEAPPQVAESLTPLRKMLGLPQPEKSIKWVESVSAASRTLQVVLPKDSRILTIQSSSSDPRAAAAFVNTLAQEYITYNQEQRWEAYQNTNEWSEVATRELKSKLEKSEAALTNFGRSAGLIFLSETENLSEEKLRQAQTELAKASADRIAKESMYESSRSSPTEALPEVLDSGPMAQYQVRLSELRRELADLSTTLLPAHYRVQRVQNQIKEIQDAMERERSNISRRIQIELDAAQQRESKLEKVFKEQSSVLANQADLLIQYNILKREVETNRQLYTTTLQQGRVASIAAGTRAHRARVIDAARPPVAPETPNLPFNLALGMFGGLLAGAGLVVIRTHADVAVHMPRSLGALNVRELGIIPSAKIDPDTRLLVGNSWAARAKAVAGQSRAVKVLFKPPVEQLELVTWNRKLSVMAEAFRATMTSILFSEHSGKRPKVLLLTSPSPQEGKSTVVSNLAIALAEINQRVLLIDADMRLPKIHRVFDVPNTFGLSDILHERTPIDQYDEDTLVRKTEIPGLHVLPAGPARTTLSRLLYSPRMKELVDRLRGTFDIILIDSAPVLTVPDPRILARSADAVILVIRAHKTAQEAAVAAIRCFSEDRRPVLGTILNDWNPNAPGSGYYAYGSYGTYYTPYSRVDKEL